LPRRAVVAALVATACRLYAARMPTLLELPWRDDDGQCRVVIEAPRGSVVKLKYEPAIDAFVFGHRLPRGTTYPYDWGFIPGTCAEDGDPLDAMVLLDAPTWPGVVIPSIPIGLVRVVQRDGKRKTTRNDRIIAVAADDPTWDDVAALPKRVRSELEGFFVTAGQQSHDRVVVEGWRGPSAARAAIERAASPRAS
jgi:inorganic pyrophosphatase